MKVAIIYNKDLTGVINTFGMQNKEFYSEGNVKRVADSLEKAGHNVRILDGNMYIIERLQNFLTRVMDGEQMGMVFNMAYGVQGESRYTHIPSMLEMLGIPYVGSNPSGHAVALDKVMTKIVWQNQNLPTPDFWVFNSAQDDFSEVKFPVIVKPKMESVSFGLRVVYNEEDLKEAVHYIVIEFQQQALVEQFIRGREFCVGLLGNSPIETFPVLEIDLEGNPDAIQTVDDKKKRPKRKICPADLPDELVDAMKKFSVEAFKVLGLRDFARVDIRLDENNQIYLLEINSMASLGASGSYVAAAKVAGYDFDRLVNKMLDVAAVRYFSTGIDNSLMVQNGQKHPLHSKLRTFLKSRQGQVELLLERIVNFNTYVRNVEGINKAAELIKNELTALGFTNEVFPQMEVGHMLYFSNSYDEEIDYFLLLSLDDHHKMAEQENYHATEHRLYGTGVWENKGGIVVTIAALQALRFAKLLRKKRIGIFVSTDSTISGKYSKNLIENKAKHAGQVLGLFGGNSEGSIVLSRSGSALYNFDMKLLKPVSEDVAQASRYFYKTLTAVVDSVKNEPGNLVAPYKANFSSNIFKGHAFGTAKISVRFDTLEDYHKIDERLRKLLTLNKEQKKLFKNHFEGGITRPPMVETQENKDFFTVVKKLAKQIDLSIVAEHRWSSADICNIERIIPKLDGFGPNGGYDNQKAEYILRHSLVDRALLLAMLIK